MKEYCLSNKILEELRQRGQIRHEDYVLCRIKRKVKAVYHQKEVGQRAQPIYSEEEENIGMYSSNNSDQNNIVLADDQQPMVGSDQLPMCTSENMQVMKKKLQNYFDSFASLISSTDVRMETSSTTGDSNDIVVANQQQPMQLGCQEDETYYMDCSCVPNNNSEEIITSCYLSLLTSSEEPNTTERGEGFAAFVREITGRSISNEDQQFENTNNYDTESSVASTDINNYSSWDLLHGQAGINGQHNDSVPDLLDQSWVSSHGYDEVAGYIS